MGTVERDITLTCVSNPVGGPYVGAARWLGVPLADVLARAGIDSTKADQILSTDVDGMTISTPLDVALDGQVGGGIGTHPVLHLPQRLLLCRLGCQRRAELRLAAGALHEHH